jgi:hypothetical protein
MVIPSMTIFRLWNSPTALGRNPAVPSKQTLPQLAGRIVIG